MQAVKHIYFSSITVYVFAAMLVVNAGVLFFFSSAPPCAVLLILEGLLTCMLATEVIMRAVMQGSLYMTYRGNQFDVIVLMMCVLLFAITAIKYNNNYFLFNHSHTHTPPHTSRETLIEEEEVDELVTEYLLVFRFVVQVGRMISLASHSVRSNISQEEVDFSSISANTDDL
eukprot:GHVR01099403.1.p1 GENE.GHVR01099403.1~~GHVR01099403.1.p1  ORF type:complete len:172 (+),score=34.27 GHVR01099403.1:39-554(+)